MVSRVMMTKGRFYLLATLALLLFVNLSPVSADVPKPTTSPAVEGPSKAQLSGQPKTVDDMKIIQEQLKAVVKKCLPATVGIINGQSAGSGVIVTADGYILTAGHVCAEANKDVTIYLADGRRVKGKTLGINRDIDSGMMKITTEGEYPFVEIGRSAPLKVGQWVVSLGHPLGYRKDRPPVLRLGHILTNTRSGVDIECTLVSGDSGGPSFDLDGKLIGIHSRIGNTSTFNVDVPIDTYPVTWDRLAAAETWGDKIGAPPGGGKRAPAMGVPNSPVTLGVGGRDDPAGCKIEEVTANSAAEKAGIKVGDIITAIDKQKIDGIISLATAVSKHKPEDKVKLEIQRDGEKIEISAVLKKRG